MIVFRKKVDAWVVTARDAERQIVTIGNYKTEEEAKVAEKDFKDKRLAEAYALQQHRLHHQAEAMFERYNRYLEFCVLPKSLTQMREQLDQDKNTAANTIRSLMARGFMKSIVLDDKGKHKKYNFDDKKLSELYMTQRKTDRANMKSPKNYVSGSTMSTSDW